MFRNCRIDPVAPPGKLPTNPVTVEAGHDFRVIVSGGLALAFPAWPRKNMTPRIEAITHRRGATPRPLYMRMNLPHCGDRIKATVPQIRITLPRQRLHNGKVKRKRTALSGGPHVLRHSKAILPQAVPPAPAPARLAWPLLSRAPRG